MKRLIVILTVVVTCSGCIWPTYVRPVEKMPVINADPKPEFDVTILKSSSGEVTLNEREQRLLDLAIELVRYIKIREARIDAYNVYAEFRNKLFKEQGKKLRK